MVSRDGQVRVMDFGLARQADKPAAGEKVVITDEGVTSTQRLPTPLADPAAPKMPLDGSTLVLGAAGSDSRPTDLEQGNTVAFDQRLTRTGAMMGTPAYMAPEQFRGNATDARTDQFAFCVALWEALYGERPFAGNTLMALTTNVVNGRIREATASGAANTGVPLWLRKILLRGLRVNADERYQSMGELLEVLGKDPAVAHKKAAFIAAGAIVPTVAVLAIAFGVRPSAADRTPPCTGGPAKLAGIWELTASGAPETSRQAQLHEAFLMTGKSYAKDVWATTSRSLTNYARSWADMYKETCEATEVQKAQSPDTMDLRMECLSERLGGLRALTDVFASANAEVVENAVSAANALASLDRCADVSLLKAVVRPPEDIATRGKVDDLRKRVAELKAKFDAGAFRQTVDRAPALVTIARGIGYRPLVAETLALLGTAAAKSEKADLARQSLMEAFLAAEASRHDEVRADVAAVLVYVVGYQEGHFDEAYRWAKVAEAILQRLGGHDLLRAWSLNDVGAVYFRQGDRESAIRVFKESLVLKEKVLGRNHPDVGLAEGNLAISLAEMGRHEEALAHIESAIKIVERGLGAAHPDFAVQLNNQGEILNALHRYAEARAVFERSQQVFARELGSENRGLADSLTGMGISYLDEGEAASAIHFLERARQIRTTRETNPAKRAEADFALARALWASNKDRTRARLLADEARSDYARAGEKLKSNEVEAWLRDRRSI
jgi:serine/threonine-protein kinase